MYIRAASARKEENVMKKDVTQKHYMKDAGRVADLLNVQYFNGDTVIQPEDVRTMDNNSIFFKSGKEQSQLIVREYDRTN